MNEPLLFLPGMMCDARLFAPQLAAFSGTRPVMVFPMTAQACFTKTAEDILANAPPKFALAGLSMGGIAAMEIFRLAPSRVTRLALMDTNPLAEDEDVALGREPQIKNALGGNLRAVIRDEMKPSYLSDGPGKQVILDLCMEMAESLGPEVFARQSRALQNRREQSETLRAVDIPALILCGEDDSLCPLERHTLMHNLISGSRLRVIKGAGHLPTLEQSTLTNQELSTWLKQ